MELSDQIAKRIKALRHHQGLTQEKLAELAKMDSTMLARIEGGTKANVKVNTLQKIIEALGISYRDFFTFTDSEDDREAAFASLNLINDQVTLKSLRNIIEQLAKTKQ